MLLHRHYNYIIIIYEFQTIKSLVHISFGLLHICTELLNTVDPPYSDCCSFSTQEFCRDICELLTVDPFLTQEWTTSHPQETMCMYFLIIKMDTNV